MSSRATRCTLLLAATVSACAEPAKITSTSMKGTAAVVAAAGISVVMSNLNSPRGLSWGPEGALYVAEAGTTTVTGACIQVIEGGLVTKCYSGTGSVSRLWNGQQQRIVSGLPSTFLVENGFAAGPQDISLHGRGNAYVPIGLGNNPAIRTAFGEAGALLGTLINLAPSGEWRVIADISAFEVSDNPAGGPVDSNPYGVLAEAGRSYVVDAGGNSLLEVSATGAVSVIAVFPSTPAPPPFNQSEAVPTKVERGPDGALYVSTLSGVPFAAGNAVIYRVLPGQAPQVFAGGFKMITDFAFGPDGSIYVVQFATDALFLGGPGALIRVTPDGTRSTITTELFQPTGVVVGKDGSVYVSNKGTLTGQGEVLRIDF